MNFGVLNQVLQALHCAHEFRRSIADSTDLAASAGRAVRALQAATAVSLHSVLLCGVRPPEVTTLRRGGGILSCALPCMLLPAQALCAL